MLVGGIHTIAEQFTNYREAVLPGFQWDAGGGVGWGVDSWVQKPTQLYTAPRGSQGGQGGRGWSGERVWYKL